MQIICFLPQKIVYYIALYAHKLCHYITNLYITSTYNITGQQIYDSSSIKEIIIFAVSLVNNRNFCMTKGKRKEIWRGGLGVQTPRVHERSRLVIQSN